MSSKDGFKPFLLHHLEGYFQSQIKVHCRCERIAVLGGRFSIWPKIEIELR